MLYSHEMVSLLQQLRSRIQSEFGLKLRLTDPDLLTSLGDLGHRSRDPFTRDTIVKLMSMAEIPYSIAPKPRNSKPKQDLETPPKTTTITYRGQKIQKLASESEDDASPRTVASKQVYRGQVVSK